MSLTTRLTLLTPMLLGLAATYWLYQSHGPEVIAWAKTQQQLAQRELAVAIRGIRSGTDPWALTSLLVGCFVYGVVHAIGPGHGKVLIGGAAFATRSTAWRMAGIGFAASLAQAVTAVVLVYGGLGLLSLSSGAIIGSTERVLVPLSYAAMTLIGAWIIWRGLRMVTQAGQSAAADAHGHSSLHAHAAHHDHHSHHGHDHHHDQHHHNCTHGHGSVATPHAAAHVHGSDCAAGCKHTPTAHEVEHARSWRDVIALIAAIGVRPCSGALIALVIAWRFELFAAGAASAFAMAIGTGIVVAGVALAATALRRLDFGLEGDGSSALAVTGAIQAFAGLAIVLLCALLFASSLGTTPASGLLR